MLRMPWVTLSEHVRFSADKMVKAPLFESARLLCDVYCLEPGQQQKTHVHDDTDKGYFVLTGTPTVILGEEERVLQAGQGAVAPAGVPHGLRNDAGERATLLVVQARRERTAAP